MTNMDSVVDRDSLWNLGSKIVGKALILVSVVALAACSSTGDSESMDSSKSASPLAVPRAVCPEPTGSNLPGRNPGPECSGETTFYFNSMWPHSSHNATADLSRANWPAKQAVAWKVIGRRGPT
ncbi:MAG: hypothetical protein ACE37N_00375 [Pseudohongiellaceae bacterium]